MSPLEVVDCFLVKEDQISNRKLKEPVWRWPLNSLIQTVLFPYPGADWGLNSDNVNNSGTSGGTSQTNILLDAQSFDLQISLPFTFPNIIHKNISQS